MERVTNLSPAAHGHGAPETPFRLAEALTSVEGILDRRPDAHWLATMRPRLGALTAVLERHFAGEGAGDLYRELPMEVPRFARRLEALESEHAVILDHARATVSLAGELSDDAETYELRELDAHVQRLVGFLRRHEAEENEIVLRAYWEEVGAAD